MRITFNQREVNVVCDVFFLFYFTLVWSILSSSCTFISQPQLLHHRQLWVLLQWAAHRPIQIVPFDLQVSLVCTLKVWRTNMQSWSCLGPKLNDTEVMHVIFKNITTVSQSLRPFPLCYFTFSPICRVCDATSETTELCGISRVDISTEIHSLSAFFHLLISADSSKHG